MSKSRTVTEPTVHGEVEYKVVECTSCEMDVAKDDAKYFIIGEKRREYDHSHKHEVKFYSDSTATGWVCPDCDEEPLRFPRTQPGSSIPNITEIPMKLLVGLAVGPPRAFANEFQRQMDLDDFDRDAISVVLMTLWVVTLILGTPFLAAVLL